MADAAVVAHRLARLRAERAHRRAADAGAASIRSEVERLWREPYPAPMPSRPSGAAASLALAERLAFAVGGEVVRSPAGSYVRCEPPSVELPVDRERLALLPGQPGPGPALVCLDTETTGVGSAAGTMAFLVGLGWWEGSRFRQLGLLLPDQSDEPALLAALADVIQPGAWLVTYNGRAFDWPLLVTRFRLARAPLPPHAGHLDLLPLARRLFRHRMRDTRLGTVERDALGLRRDRDIPGWRIPGLYLDFLRGGPAAPLLDVVRHNEEDVRSLARLLGHLERSYADLDGRRSVPPGDLVGLARVFRTAGRPGEALACLETALEGLAVATPPRPAWGSESLPWGARPWDRPLARPLASTASLRAEQARLLRRLGRDEEARAAWHDLAETRGPLAALALIELAKAEEHRRRDVPAAFAAVEAAARLLERARFAGRPQPRLEADLRRRRDRLVRRLARGRQAA